MLAVALWVVPSVGTRGQGTLGDRFVHADRSVMTAADDAAPVAAEPDAATRRALARADAEIVRAVTAL